MGILIILVTSGNPAMRPDPYGALVKDFCLNRMCDHGMGAGAASSRRRLVRSSFGRYPGRIWS
jgi:hypothetical protein